MQSSQAVADRPLQVRNSGLLAARRTPLPAHVLNAGRLILDAVGGLTVYLALLFVIPARWVLPGLGAAGRPASVFGLGLFAVWCIAKLLPDFERRRTPLRWALLVNAIVLLVSYGLAYDRGLNSVEALSADRELLNLLSMAGIILVASEGITSAAQVSKLTKRLTYFSAFNAVVGLIQFILGFNPYAYVRFPGLILNTELTGELASRGSQSLVRATGSTLHSIEFAVVMSLVLPIALHHALHETNRTVQWWRFAIVGLHAVGAALSVSRTAVVALVLVVGVLAWAWSPVMRVKALFAGLLSLVALRGAIPGLLGTILALFLYWQQDPSVSGRTDDYSIVSRYVQDRPWFGRGVGTFIPGEYFVLDNAYLLSLVSTGYIGLVALIGVLLTGFYLARQTVISHPHHAVRHLAVALMACILAAGISGGTFDLFFYPTATGVLLVALGCSAALTQLAPGDDPVEPYSPAGLLRPSYRVGYRRTPWWHQFDPGLRSSSEPALQEVGDRRIDQPDTSVGHGSSPTALPWKA